MIQLLTKLGTPLILAFAAFIGGITFHAKFLQKEIKLPKQQEVKIPDCICNPPAVTVQPFDVNKIKNLKSFSYAPQFTGTISVAGVDSLFIERTIDRSIQRALQRKPLKP